MSEYLNAVALDESTGAITMGVGATGWFRVDLGAGPFDADNGADSIHMDLTALR